MISYMHAVENFINGKILGFPLRLIKSREQSLRPLLIVLVALLSSAYLGYTGSERETQIMILVLSTAIAALILFRYPPLGLVAIIGSIAIPINGPSNSNATMAVVALLLGLWLLNMIIKREIILISSITIQPLLIFVLVATIAFGVGQLPWYSFASPAPLGAQLGGLSLFVLSAGAFLLAAHQVRKVRWLQVMVWVFLALGATFIVGRILPPVGKITSIFFNAPYSAGQATGSLFWTWFVALAFSQAAFNTKLHPAIRGVLVSLVLATLYVGIMGSGDWKSGWVPPLIVSIAILGLWFWRFSIIVAPLVFLPASWLVSYAVTSDAYSYSTRLDAWEIVLNITKVNPLLGLGPANYHAYTPLFRIRGYYGIEFSSHSQYIDLIAQTGILGLLTFLWFFAAVGWVGWKLKERVPEGFPQAYVYGALGGLVGTLVAGVLGDWVIPFFYNITLGGFRASVLGWLFLGGLIALEQIYANGKPSPDEKSIDAPEESLPWSYQS